MMGVEGRKEAQKAQERRTERVETAEAHGRRGRQVAELWRISLGQNSACSDFDPLSKVILNQSDFPVFPYDS